MPALVASLAGLCFTGPMLIASLGDTIPTMIWGAATALLLANAAR